MDRYGATNILQQLFDRIQLCSSGLMKPQQYELQHFIDAIVQAAKEEIKAELKMSFLDKNEN